MEGSEATSAVTVQPRRGAPVRHQLVMAEPVTDVRQHQSATSGAPRWTHRGERPPTDGVASAPFDQGLGPRPPWTWIPGR